MNPFLGAMLATTPCTAAGAGAEYMAQEITSLPPFKGHFNTGSEVCGTFYSLSAL